MDIRKAQKGDLDAIDAFQKPLYGGDFDVYHADLEKASSEGRAWVAVEGGKVVGYHLCELFGPEQKYFPDSIFLSEIFVDPGFRNRGIGSRLLSSALEEPWPQEYKYFSLTHDPADAHLTPFYEMFGFKVCGKTDSGNVMMTRPR